MRSRPLISSLSSLRGADAQQVLDRLFCAALRSSIFEPFDRSPGHGPASAGVPPASRFSQKRLANGVRTTGVQLLEHRHEEPKGVVPLDTRLRVAGVDVRGDSLVSLPLLVGHLDLPDRRPPRHEAPHLSLTVPDQHFAEAVFRTQARPAPERGPRRTTSPGRSHSRSRGTRQFLGTQARARSRPAFPSD